jgi:methylmalonyl-CoA/ethylmalonyl-CoA epimerase
MNFRHLPWEKRMGNESNKFKLNQIGQIAIPVRNLEKAITFYRDGLGMDFLFQAPPGLALFDCGGIRLMLDVPAGEQSENRSSIIYYKVDDLPSAVAALKSRGVTFDQEPELVAEMPDHELWMAFLRDPDENTLALMWEKRE